MGNCFGIHMLHEMVITTRPLHLPTASELLKWPFFCFVMMNISKVYVLFKQAVESHHIKCHLDKVRSLELIPVVHLCNLCSFLCFFYPRSSGKQCFPLSLYDTHILSFFF